MSSDDQFTFVAKLGDLNTTAGTRISLRGHDIALFVRDHEVYAISNVCAHQHLSLLHSGELEGCVVTCPMHGWSFDVRTGKATRGHGRVQSYPVEVRNGDVYIMFADDIPSW